MKVIYFIIGILVVNLTFGQNTSLANLESQVDQIVSKWPNDGPGGVLGIIDNGELVFQKAYGQASLEFDIPNTTSTRFNIASVSKQFTAYSMILLEEQGKLSIDDDIRKHIPELPDFGTTITIRHLLTHTSGFRNFQNLLAMAGWRSGDPMTNDDLLRFIIKQKELNFPVGSEYLYCNTGFVLCVHILERITGMDFKEWTKKNIFIPLEMNNSEFIDDMQVVRKNTAKSYFSSGDYYKTPLEFYNYMGNGNIYTTIKDLGKWIRHFSSPKLGGEASIQRLTERGILNNGDTLTYALGIGVIEHNGKQKWSHGGSIGSYRSSLSYFPDRETGFVVITNYSAANPGKVVNGLIKAYLGEDYIFPSSARGNSSTRKEGKKEAPDQLVKYTGTYYSPELNTTYTISLEDEKLICSHQRHNNFEIVAQEKDKLVGNHFAFRDIKVVRWLNGEIKGLRVSNGRVRDLWFEKTR